LRIEHIALWTDQLEQLKDFYGKYFGAKVGNHYRNPKKQFESYFLSFASGSRMELMHQPGKANTLSSPGEPNIGYAHISFATGSAESVNELTNRLRQDGIVVLDGPRLTGDGYYESLVLDPDGNRVELTI
jgi:lactoylglutathione lyase